MAHQTDSQTRLPKSEKRRTRLPGFAQVTRAAIMVLLLRPLAYAQDVTEPALKAAFIYNFALFTTWPDVSPDSAPFVICVVDDAAVADALERVVKGVVLAGHSIAVSHGARAGLQAGCHVLYVSGVVNGEAAKLVAGLRDLPVLTIGEGDGFTKIGGIARFFFENGRLRFNVHRGSAQRARLQISSKLLGLARPE